MTRINSSSKRSFDRIFAALARPYMLALLGAGLIVAVAWATQGQRHPVVPGSVAPDYSALTLAGDTVHIEDHSGEVVLLNIWATWCPPCREEMPSMERLFQHFQQKGAAFEILAVSIDAQKGESDALGNEGGDLAAFAQAHNLTFTILHDPSGRIQQTYQTTGVPESFLIGRDGVIYRRLAGAATWDSEGYRELIERLLASGPENER